MVRSIQHLLSDEESVVRLNHREQLRIAGATGEGSDKNPPPPPPPPLPPYEE